jgi:hypothetical protein
MRRFQKVPDFGSPKICARAETHRPDFFVVELRARVLGLEIYVARDFGRRPRPEPVGDEDQYDECQQ